MMPLATALDLVNNCVPVVPVTADGTLLIELNAASIHPVEISRWWQRWPDALVAVPTGRRTELAVIHVDDPADLPDVSRTWLAKHADLLYATRTHETPAGGLDFWFRTGSMTTVTASPALSNSVQLNGVSVRGDDDFAVFWPAHGLRREGSVRPLPQALRTLFEPHPPIAQPPDLDSESDRRDAGNAAHPESENNANNGLDAAGAAIAAEPTTAANGETHATAADPKQTDGQPHTTALSDAVAFLAKTLEGGARLEAAQLYSQARDAGHAARTVRRAQKQLHIRPERDGHTGRWYWRLP